MTIPKDYAKKLYQMTIPKNYTEPKHVYEDY